MNTASSAHFQRQYQRHLKHLELKGLQAKTIEAYSRAIRRVGERFDGRIDNLTEPQLADYFTDLKVSHSRQENGGKWGQVLSFASNARGCGGHKRDEDAAPPPCPSPSKREGISG